MEGLSTQDELFAIRLLELARHVFPRGNRVDFVRSCEESGLRTFLESFGKVWQQITDDPPREGITPAPRLASKRTAFALQAAAFQELVASQLSLAGIGHLWLDGLSLSRLLYEDITAREFEELRVFVSPGSLWSSLELLRGLGFQSEHGVNLGPGQKKALVRWCHEWELEHEQTGLKLVLQWRLFSKWIDAELLPFEECAERAQVVSWEGLSDWSTPGSADTLVYLALRAYQSGWSSMQPLLDLAVGLDVFDYTWDQVLDIAGPRAVLVERAVELTVRLLGVPHPQGMTYYYSDYSHALLAWTRWLSRDKPPREELLQPRFWSCDSTFAVRKRLAALVAPEREEIESLALPCRLIFLYPVLHGLRMLFRRRSP